MYKSKKNEVLTKKIYISIGILISIILFIILVVFVPYLGKKLYEKLYDYNDYSNKLNTIEYDVYYGMSEEKAMKKYEEAKKEWENYYNKEMTKINKLMDFQASINEYDKYIGNYSNGENNFTIKKENNRFIFATSNETHDIIFDDNEFYYYNEQLKKITIGYMNLYYKDKIHINGEKPYSKKERGI